VIAMQTIDKKTYVQPEMSVIQLSTKFNALLAGSNPVMQFVSDEDTEEDFEWGSGGGL